MMLLVSINLNSILPGMIRSSQRLNQLSLITQDVLKKYAKEIKQAKLEEFRSFLNFTAMCFRDKRRQKIDKLCHRKMGANHQGWQGWAVQEVQG